MKIVGKKSGVKYKKTYLPWNSLWLMFKLQNGAKRLKNNCSFAGVRLFFYSCHQGQIIFFFKIEGEIIFFKNTLASPRPPVLNG